LPPFDLETATGNFIVEALGEGQFALYAHLQTGSVRVRPGDHVRRGQPIGRVGNTGNSTQPHLHFHVMAGSAPLASDGLPFVFDRFLLEATIDFTAPTPVVLPVPPPQQRRNRLPMTGDFIAFPGKEH
jgi:murein DD-endopeptidase MepM/ murein hydrolase activator NlpD